MARLWSNRTPALIVSRSPIVKASLAMLSDHANRRLLSPEERAAIDRILPWTRMVRPGPVTLEDGRTVDLYDHAISHPGDLILKPGDVVAVKENSRALAYFKDLAEDMASRDIASWVEVEPKNLSGKLMQLR